MASRQPSTPRRTRGGRVGVSYGVPGRSGPLWAVPGRPLEITATRPSGFADDKIRVVPENARALKFAQVDFGKD